MYIYIHTANRMLLARDSMALTYTYRAFSQILLAACGP